MARQYIKKSQYWENRKASSINQSVPAQIAESSQLVDVNYEFDGSPHYTQASCDNYSQSYRNIGNNQSVTQIDKYPNITKCGLPFAIDGNNYSIAEALKVVYAAYFNVQIIRNYINMMADFSKSKLHIRSTNKTVKQFFLDWFDIINIDKLMAEYFLEYYRSGNVFTYTFTGKIQERDFETLKASFGSKKDTLPIRYIILNPMQVQLQYGPGYRNNWIKVLSKYELARLKDPQTPEDKQVLDSLPEATKRLIKNSGQFQYVYIPLDASRLHYVFYKKQNYEPFSVPPLYGVLNDIEWKLELKRMDLALSRTIEQVILLVTTGDKPDQFQKGTNPRNIERLQSIFKNQTIGRVLVADYSTKAEWVIPDLKELLGNAKYERVNQDIQDGLQYMFFGNDKFANASIKVKMFIEALREGRDMFLKEFLIPEAKKIVEALNFKHLPEFEFEEVQLQDEALMNKIYIQMAQMGLLTPDELNDAIETGILPLQSESLENQKEYIKRRKEGLYTPLLGGNDMSKEESDKDSGSNSFNGQQGGRPTGSGTPQMTKKISPIGTKANEDRFSVTKIINTIKKADSIKESVAKLAKKKWKIKQFNETQDSVLELITKSIILNENEENWESSASSYLNNPKEIDKDLNNQLDDICINYDVDSWVAAILYKSKI